MILHGRNLIIKVNGTAIAGARSCKIEVNGDLLEIASPSQGSYREFIAGRKTWKVTTGQLVIIDTVNGLTLASQKNMVNQTVTIRVEIKDVQNDGFYGSAICNVWEVQGTLGNLAQGSFSFQGSGALTDITSS